MIADSRIPNDLQDIIDKIESGEIDTGGFSKRVAKALVAMEYFDKYPDENKKDDPHRKGR